MIHELAVTDADMPSVIRNPPATLNGGQNTSFAQRQEQ